MNLLPKRYQSASPYLIVLFIATLFFIISSFYPYEITCDVALQLKSVQQWLKAESNLFNSVVVPKTADLSRDVQAWITVLPPGVPLFFMPMVALGLPLGVAAKFTAYVLFILGCLGWIKLANTLQANFPTKIIFSLMLPLYSVTIASVNVLYGDVLPFGIMPWLFLYTLYVSRCFQSVNKAYGPVAVNSCLSGILLGSVFWLKYSAFLVSLGLLLYLAICFLFFKSKYSFKKRFLLLVICATSFLSLVFIFVLANKHFSGIFSHMLEHKHRDDLAYIIRMSPGTRGPQLLISLLGSPGLALSQSHGWLSHIILCSDSIFPFFRSLGFFQRAIPLAIAGIPGTLIFFWLLFYSVKIFGKRIFIFACCITFIPFVLLGYVSNIWGYNILIFQSNRYVSAFFVFTQILLIGALYQIFSKTRSTKMRVFISFVFVVFFLVPSLFHLASFVKNTIVERLGHKYITTENRIYVPTLSETNVKSAVDKINSVIKSPRDVVILAVIDCYGASDGPWLEIKTRCIPLNHETSHFSLVPGLEGAYLTSSTTFKTSKDLRVIIVISKYLEKDENILLKLKQRFPQTKIWTRLEDNADTETLVSIWYADLKVS